ncbi:MAG: hypothetical protein KF698_08210 [Anaerolineales bacterium]|nr:hypothetical protein [Anaerolineales bacterium]
MSTSPAPELSEQTIANILARIREGYRQIAKANGFGTIRITIERAGSSKEKIILGVETERPVSMHLPQDE